MGKHKNKHLATDLLAPSQSVKRWNPEFFKNRRKEGQINDRLFVEALTSMKVQRSMLDVFLQNSEYLGSSWEAEQVRKFFRDTQCFPTARLWLDLRSKFAAVKEVQSKWMTLGEMRNTLMQQVSHLY